MVIAVLLILAGVYFGYKGSMSLVNQKNMSKIGKEYDEKYALFNKIVCIISAMIIIYGCVIFIIFVDEAKSSSTGSSSYTCGYCGTVMHGGYYDYINGKYACRLCSKKYRN